MLVALSLVFMSQLVQINTKELPHYYPRCYRDDPNLNACLLKATETMKPFLVKGVPELNVPSISPFYIPEVSLQQGTNAVNYKAFLKNLVVTGLDTYKFTQFDFDVPNLKFAGAVDMGLLKMEADYLVSGKILAVPLEGMGKVYANITHSNGTLTEQSRLVVKKGVTYLEPMSTTIKINVGDVSSRMDGLFNGNEELARVTNKVIQDNLRELVEDVKPAIEEVLTSIMENVLFKSVARVPYDHLYPLLKDKDKPL